MTKNLHTIAGFGKYLFCMETNRVWSKHSGRFLTRNDSGKYQMIADNARYAYRSSNRVQTVLTPMQVRSKVAGRATPVTQATPVVKAKPWFVLQIIGSGASCVARCDTEHAAKSAAGGLATKNPGSIYVVAEQKHQVQAQGLVWA